jgi:chaperonin GroES
LFSRVLVKLHFLGIPDKQTLLTWIQLEKNQLTSLWRKKMKVRPLNDRILVKRLEEEETTKGGIIIPDSAKEKPAEGEVIAVGKGKLNDKGDRIEMDVKVGDRVLFSKYGGTDVKFDGVDHLIMREDDILAIVEG